MAAKGRKRRHRSSVGHERPPRHWNAYPYDDGVSIVVELHGSRNGLREKQLATLDSLRLRKRGDISEIRFRRHSTPGMLHKVRHVVTTRGPEPAFAGAVDPPEAWDVMPATYQASGGESLLLRVETKGRVNGVLRVEAQKGSFALVWPSKLSARKFVATLHALWWPDEGTVTTVVPQDDEPEERSLSEIEHVLTEKGRRLRFLRIDSAERSFTWSAHYDDLDRSGLREEADDALSSAHEVSFAADEFNPEFARALLSSTAIFKPEQLVDELVEQAGQNLGYLPYDRRRR